VCHQVRGAIKSSTIAIEKVWDNYFVAFEKSLVGLWDPSYDRACSPKFLELLCNFVLSHAGILGCPASAHHALKLAEADLLAKLGNGSDTFKTVISYNAHWVLRDEQHAAWHSCSTSPPARTLCIQWDAQDGSTITQQSPGGDKYSNIDIT
jgi:hypothetical protein